MATKEVNPAEKMLRTKKKLIKRLTNEIALVRQNAEEEVEQIKSRIRLAQVLADALEKGTLKP